MAKASRVEHPATDDCISTLWSLPLADRQARIAAVLDPIGQPVTAAPGSDHDLNPDIAPPLDGRPAAVLVLLIARPQGLSVLFTQRADRLRRHAGQISFPGGLCEPDEAPWETALREAHEEVGLDPGLVRVAGLSAPYRTLTGYHITPVVGFAPASIALTLNAEEVASAFEVPLAFLMDPANHERRHRGQPPGPPRWHYALTWDEAGTEPRVIWGATAGMLRMLYERLAAGHDPA